MPAPIGCGRHRPAARVTAGVRERSTPSRWLTGISPALGGCAYGLLIAIQLGCSAKATAPTTGSPRSSYPGLSVAVDRQRRGTQAQAQTASSQPVSDQPFFWSTSDSTVASSRKLRCGGTRAGCGADRSQRPRRSGFARVIVVNAAVHSVTLRPAIDTIYAGSPTTATTLTATAYDSAGRPLPGRPILWSTNSAIVTVAGVV